MMISLKSLFATTISTEPVILFLNLGVGILYGSGIPTYLLYEKVCRYTLGYDEETCDNLGEEENEDVSVEVQCCLMAKLDCARVEGRGRNPRKGRDQILQRSIAWPKSFKP